MPDQTHKVDQPIIWYVTISPNPRKILDNKKCYASLKDYQQISFIQTHINKSLHHRMKKLPLVSYEYNKRLMIHCHFEIELSQRQAKAFQINLNNALGSTRLNPDIAVNMCPFMLWKPKGDYDTWEEYCLKDPVQLVESKCICVQCKIAEGDRKLVAKIESGEIVL